MKRRLAKRAFEVFAALCVLIAASFAAARVRPENTLRYDPAYWPAKHLKSGNWDWCLTPSGINYSIYIPAGADGETAKACIPMIVVFHGSTEKGLAKDKYGRLFTADAMQKRFGPRGVAVLAVQSRVEYFSDPHAYARLIKNVAMRHRCVDPERIAGYGFSQGAAFVQELAMYDPSLFKAVVSGSSYYAASIPELLRAARVRFWCATSRNDRGIYEQGNGTARALAAICPDSRYVEYETRGHFFVEMADKSGRGTETAADWLAKALAAK